MKYFIQSTVDVRVIRGCLKLINTNKEEINL